MIFSAHVSAYHPKVSQGAPHEAYMGFELMVLVALSLYLSLVLPPPYILSAAQSFATCSRNSLYLIFVAGYYGSIMFENGVSKNGSVDQ
jgi:hypothetical protein